MWDDFDDSGDEKAINELSWQKKIEEINKDGFRTGIEAGQESSLQEGFDTGFGYSAQLLFLIASLRGKVNGKLTYNLLKPGFLSSSQQSALEKLLADVVELEMQVLPLSKEFLQHFSKKASARELNTSNSEMKSQDLEGKADNLSATHKSTICEKADNLTRSTGLHKGDVVSDVKPEGSALKGAVDGNSNDEQNQDKNRTVTSQPVMCGDAVTDFEKVILCSDFPCIRQFKDLDMEFNRIIHD